MSLKTQIIKVYLPCLIQSMPRKWFGSADCVQREDRLMAYIESADLNHFQGTGRYSCVVCIGGNMKKR